jgi:hypothetical protein
MGLHSIAQTALSLIEFCWTASAACVQLEHPHNRRSAYVVHRDHSARSSSAVAVTSFECATMEGRALPASVKR